MNLLFQTLFTASFDLVLKTVSQILLIYRNLIFKTSTTPLQCNLTLFYFANLKLFLYFYNLYYVYRYLDTICNIVRISKNRLRFIQLTYYGVMDKTHRVQLFSNEYCSTLPYNIKIVKDILTSIIFTPTIPTIVLILKGTNSI
ncbi:hypothetical protein H8356DRAFT_1428241 [Neocallimastix lanati (nom. inval.)]|nr:hypothetical protein H8356DRAFT_1428241 [Neocallimastix sp. JGI-2020a]